MKASEILELVRAGYTKEEINSLVGEVTNNIESAEENQDVKPDDHDPDPPEKQQPDDDLSKKLEGLETRLNHIINKMTLDAVKNSRQPENQTETTEDILAAFVRGQKKEE